MKKKIMMVMLVGMMLVMGVSAEAGWFSKLFGIKENKEDGKIKIGFLLKTMQEARYQKDKKYFIDAAYEAGADEVIFGTANNSEKKQMEELKKMLDKGIDILVLQAVNTSNIGDMMKEIHDAKIQVISYDSVIMNAPIDLHIMQNSWDVGKIQGEAMIEWFYAVKGEVKGNVVVIKGQPGDTNANMMTYGAALIIRQNHGLYLVAEVSHENWSPEAAEKTAEKLLLENNNNIDAFICNNSGMARGVMKALKKQNLNSIRKVFVAGSDADLENIKSIIKGEQAMEVFKKIKPLAETAAKVAVKMAKYKKLDPRELFEITKETPNNYKNVPTIVTDVVKVTIDNIEDTVIKDGYYTREEIYNN